MAVPVQRGDTLAGKYLVEEILGEGAMGVVVAAVHVELGKRVALKFMKLEAISSQDGVERFLREARAAGRLRSEHACQVHDVGRLENGAPYIVMELLNGEDIQTQLERCGRLPPGEVARYMLEICEAMDEAHAAGIVHRDLKPQNLFRLRKSNGTAHIKVLDFGVSKLNSASELLATATHAVIGTPAYMSPEQLSSSKTVDGRSDIWSLGVIMYQLLIGRIPFEGTDFLSLGIAIVHTPLVFSPRAIRPELDPLLEAIILRCLTKDRERRYASAADLARALVRFADPVVMWEQVPSPSRGDPPPDPIPTTPVSVPSLPVIAALGTTLRAAAGESVRENSRRRPRPGLAIGVAAAVVAVGAIFIIAVSVNGSRKTGTKPALVPPSASAASAPSASAPSVTPASVTPPDASTLEEDLTPRDAAVIGAAANRPLVSKPARPTARPVTVHVKETRAVPAAAVVRRTSPIGSPDAASSEDALFDHRVKAVDPVQERVKAAR
jgi:serine/threonine protein kinase